MQRSCADVNSPINESAELTQESGGPQVNSLPWAVLRIRDVYPGSRIYPSRIQKQQQKRGVEKKFVVAKKFTKIKIILFLSCLEAKFGQIFKGL